MAQTCPDCGAALEREASFCIMCGHRVPAKAPEKRPPRPSNARLQPGGGVRVVPARRVCGSCGAVRSPTAKFCNQCGSSQ